MGKRTEFNLRTVPTLFGVIDEKVTRGDLLVDILKLSLKFEEQLDLAVDLSSLMKQGFIITNKEIVTPTAIMIMTCS